jgi:DNA-binding Lrp family transcriptional regulator
LKLKETDKKMLNLLQNGDLCVPRTTRLAHMVGLPPSTVHERLKLLQKEGYLGGYSVDLNPKKLEKDFVVFMMGQMQLTKLREQKNYAEEVGNLVAKLPFVEEVYFIAGEWDIMCKMRCKDKEDYYDKMKKVVQHFDVRSRGIITTHTFKDEKKFTVD